LGYDKVVTAIYEVFILRKYDKQRAVWIQGVPDTGKSTICRIIEEIFICERFVEGHSHFHVQPVKKPSHP
jgi:hypothetical protein